MDNEQLKMLLESVNLQGKILAKIRFVLRVLALTFFAIVYSVIVALLIGVLNYMDVIINSTNYLYYIGTLVILAITKLLLIACLIVVSTTCVGVLHLISLIKK